MPIPTTLLSSGHPMPLLGYGTGTALFKRSGVSTIDEATVSSISAAIAAGFTHLDGAELYNNEAELGAAIQNSGLPRDHFFVTTKVINNIDSIATAIDVSLEKLGLKYIDLYLIHSPWFAKSDAELQNAWTEMEKVQHLGKARSIGVSNYLIEHLEVTLQKAEIVPAVNQVEFHPYLQRGNLVDWSKERGIVTSAFGPLTTITKGKPGPVDEVLQRLSQKYGVSESAVALRWCVDMGVVAVTTTRSEERCREYLKAGEFSLTAEEVEVISKLGGQKHLRCNNFMHEWDPEDRR